MVVLVSVFKFEEPNVVFVLSKPSIVFYLWIPPHLVAELLVDPHYPHYLQ